ncbi:hypothetical protein SB01139_04601 [Klebsiella pneumoniae]|nr:hypothetical protein SB01139_04601 [Klebsiella pneumoniae]
MTVPCCCKERPALSATARSAWLQGTFCRRRESVPLTSGATTRFLWFISARACSTWATGASSITSETGLSLRAAGATASGSSRSSRLIHRIMLFPFTLPAPRWRFTSRRRDDVQLPGRQPAHPPARGQLLIHAYPSPLSVPILQKPRPASLIPNRPAIAPLRKLRRAAGILNRLERVTLGRQQRQR